MSTHNTAKVVLFDIDHTLFDTKTYLHHCFSALASLTSTDTIYSLAKEIYSSQRKTGYFSPELFAKELSQKSETVLSSDAIRNIFFDEAILKTSLYPDVVPTLEILSNTETIAIGVFSGGNQDLQMKKLSTVEHLLHQEVIHIFEKDKHKAIDEVIKKYSDFSLFVVDDLLSVLAKFKTINSEVHTIWIIRHEETKNNQAENPYAADSTISSLSEIVPLLVRE